jgi:hypothetical protein
LALSNFEDTPYNSRPNAGYQKVFVDDSTQPVIIDLSPLISDVDQDPLTVKIAFTPRSGTASVNANNQIAYYAGDNFLGSDSFWYEVDDGRGGRAWGTIDVFFSGAQKKLLHITGRTEDPGGFGPVFSWKSFGIPSIFAGGWQAGWLGTIREQTSRTAIFRRAISWGPLGSPERWITVGYPVPSNSFPQAILSHIDTPVFSWYGVAFRGRIERNNSQREKRSGIWFGSYNLALVAEEGGEAPGGGHFKQFQSLALPESSNLFFTATLQTGSHGVTAKSDRGLWLWKEGGSTFKKVLGEGQMVDDGGHPALISRFNVISSVAGSPGHGRYDASNGAVDALVDFDDGTSAIANIDAEGDFHIAARTGREQYGLIFSRFGMPSSPGFNKPPVALVDFTT